MKLQETSAEQTTGGFITILPMERRHIGDVVCLERECFSSPWSEEAILSSMESGNTAFFIAELDGRTAGYCGVQYVLDEGYITNIAVFPQFRGQGIGRALVGTLVSFARENGLSLLSLEVRPTNSAAISLYRSERFETVGFRRNFYVKPAEDGLIMTRYFAVPKAE